jgi:hypothetical protein
MTVRAKFKVITVTDSYDSERMQRVAQVELQPVMSGSPENEQFYRWTPGGTIKLGTINEVAAKEFVPGREFYVDFTPADPPAA